MYKYIFYKFYKLSELINQGNPNEANAGINTILFLIMNIASLQLLFERFLNKIILSPIENFIVYVSIAVFFYLKCIRKRKYLTYFKIIENWEFNNKRKGTTLMLLYCLLSIVIFFKLYNDQLN